MTRPEPAVTQPAPVKTRPAYRRLLFASAASTTGDGIRFAALPLLSALLLDSPLKVAAVTAVSTLPWLLLGLPAGVLVDRGRRVRIMVAADVARALALAALVAGLVAGRVGFGALLGLALVMGTGEVAFDLASFAVLPGVVPAAELEPANGRLFAVQTGCRDIAGHLAGGVLVTVSRVVPFLLDAMSFAVSALLLRGVPEPPVPALPPGRLTDEIRDGFRFLLRDPVLTTLAGVAGVANAVHLGQIAILPVFALGRLHLPTAFYGALLATASVGGILGASLAGWATRRFRRDRILVAGVVLLAMQSLAIGLFPTIAVTFAGFFIAGVAMMAWNVVAVSLRQATVPARLLGRVGSVNRLISWGTMPLGGVAFGALATRFGPAPAFVAGGSAILVMGVVLILVLASTAPDDQAKGSSD